jgi:hypothetical protein
MHIVDPISDWMDKNGMGGWLEIGGKEGFLKWHRGGPGDQRESKDALDETILPKQSESETGKFSESLIQFGIGLVGAGKLLKPLKLGPIVGGMAKGVIADFTVMDPYQDRFSNIIQNASPNLAGPVAEYFSAKEEDPILVAKLKNAAEGAVIGMGVDTFMHTLGLLKNTRLLKNATTTAEKEALSEQTPDLVRKLEEALARDDAENRFPVKFNKATQEYEIVTKLSKEQEAAAVSQTGKQEGVGLRNASRRQVGEPVREGVNAGLDEISEQQSRELLSAIAEATPSQSPLHRGLSLPLDNDLYKQIRDGDEINLGVSSFSMDAEVAKDFSKGQVSNARITLELEQGAQAVDARSISKWNGTEGRHNESEWISAGKFQIVSKEVKENGDIIAKIKQVPSETTTSVASIWPRTFKSRSEAVSEAAALNTWDRTMRKVQAPGELTSAQKSSIRAQAKDLLSADNPWMNKAPGIDFNYANIRNADDAKAWMEAMSITMRSEIDAARNGAVVTNAELIKTVGNMFPGANPDEILSNLSHTFNNTRDMLAHLTAGRGLLTSLGKQVSDLSRMVDGDPDNMILMTQLSGALESLFQVGAKTKGIMTESARVVQSGNIDAADIASSMAKAGKEAKVPTKASEAITAAFGGEQGLITQKLALAIPQMDKETIQGLARKIRLADGNPSVILDTLKPLAEATEEQLQSPRFFETLNTVWVNSVLSGPLTTAQNILGTATALITTPAEKYIAGMISRDKPMRDEAVDLFAGYITSLNDAWTAGRKALNAGRSVLDPENLTQEFKSPIQGYLGDVVNFPSRVLMTQDEFFKNVSYRSYVRSQALKEAREMGMNSGQAAEHVTQMLRDAFTEGGAAINQAGIEYARYTTFTNNLRPGSMGKSLQEMMGKHPALRFAALPFVRTPTNLLLWTWDRTPLIANLRKVNREALQAGGAQAAEVWAKQATGSMVWGSAAYLAMSGTITGNGPGDPKLRKQWTDAKNQPYSVKIGDRWVSYRRADPMLMPFGIVADMYQSSGELPWEDINDIGYAFTAAMGRNLSSKSYLYGLTSFMNAFAQGDEGVVESYVRGKAASFVPSIVNQMNQDEHMREVRGVVDAFMARIHGMSEMLAPQHNFFGEPIMKAPFSANRNINPFTVSGTFVSDSVDNQLLELGKAIPYPSKTYPGTDVDLTSRKYGTKGDLTPYDRMMEIMANPGNGMPSLRDAVSKIVTGPNWEKMSPGVPGVQEGGTRFDVINNVVQKYRDMAQKRLIKEFPALKEATAVSKVSKDAARRGGPTALERVMKFFDKAYNARPSTLESIGPASQ